MWWEGCTLESNMETESSSPGAFFCVGCSSAQNSHEFVEATDSCGGLLLYV